MNRRHLLAAAAAFLATPLLAQAPVSSPAPAAADLVKVALDTEAGRIVLALDRGHAPLSTANFLRYVDAKRYDGEPFYRAMKIGDAGGLIQGGVRSSSSKLYAPIAHEPTSTTGLKNVAGTIALANSGPGTARGDFFIMSVDVPYFDATASEPGFAAFGRVVEGMDVVNKILAAPVSSTKGEGPMKGQMLDPTIKIIKASRMQ